MARLVALIKQPVGADGAVIQLATRCDSAEEFIERFARFTTETDVIVPAVLNVSVGTMGQFVIRLKDRSVIMQGRCEVTELRPVVVAPGAAPGPSRGLMRLHLREMDAHSAGIHLRLMERRGSSPAPPAPPPRTATRSLSLVPPLRAVPSPIAAPRPDAAVAPVRPPAPPAPPLSQQIAPEPVPVSLPVQGSAAVMVAVAPSLSEATEVSPLPRSETRAQGAAFTLPANPFSDLEAADLASFIDLTLLETNGPGDAAPIASGDSFGRGAQARRIARRAAPYLSCVLAGLALGIALRPGSKAGPAKATPAIVAPDPTPPAAAPPATATAPAPTRGIQNPLARDCIARVTTTPPGAAVFWGDILLGSSPIEHAAIPCGTAVVTLRRERWAEITRTIATEPGKSVAVTERMYRPSAKLVVTSSPPHALITLNRHRFGQTPRKISTLRYEHVRVEASLPGYRPWKKRLYLKESESNLVVTLVPIPKANARRATPPSAASK